MRKSNKALMDAEQVIRILGGSTAVATALREKISTVSNWRVRGVSYRQRHAVMQLAAQKGHIINLTDLDRKASLKRSAAPSRKADTAPKKRTRQPE
jgi:hypothetical protein